ncbi:hypothetical protein ACOMICROBIO_FLGHMIGD_03938 [Vibrio sp. B1FLJ16]|uniref:T6SS phospholipase effector Tle1-like catalytic domain-containing protein n=1 Tax=Vibrio sp. B1FLJ16 TaxID=2751178 RepID=UPI0015F5B61C|nr:DUF2235 domain-containing protein [Vibrio sp. B1FLJ16]CAD7819503.1 hypothetical protein ACOMICROBIO_FLGHMIGD_03938 [Vibrio sp. B1FLJ16]CAE6939093.1 hypothetical protein ACOMICROBIO_FLGHMIGD_03938 [Vibrio sp. B1FLJ16]
MTQKRIILCLDGTWNNTYTESERDDGDSVLKPTNVLKLARGVLPIDESGVYQVVYYNTGVGGRTQYPGFANSTLNKIDKGLGGGWGAGFETNIEDTLTFLINNYSKKSASKEPDEIFIFGFSRGAATARVLCKFIDWLGGIPSKKDVYYIPIIFREYLRTEGKKPAKGVINEINNPADKPARKRISSLNEISISMLGVWDTVFSLGSKTINYGRKRYLIDEVPPNCIKHIYHAISVDERRADFKPEIWSDVTSTEQVMEQRYFPGVHSNIGGGYVNDGLANCSFQYMLDKAGTLGVEFDRSFTNKYRAYPKDKLYKSKTLFYYVLDGLRFKDGKREIKIDNESITIDVSVIERMLSDPSKRNSKGELIHKNLIEFYRPENIIKLIKSIENPFSYCLSIWEKQKEKAMDESQKEKLRNLFEELKINSLEQIL